MMTDDYHADTADNLSEFCLLNIQMKLIFNKYFNCVNKWKTGFEANWEVKDYIVITSYEYKKRTHLKSIDWNYF